MLESYLLRECSNTPLPLSNNHAEWWFFSSIITVSLLKETEGEVQKENKLK